MDYLNEVVIQGLNEEMFSEAGREQLIKMLDQALKLKQGNIDSSIKDLEKQRKDAQKIIDNVVQAVAQGFTSEHLKEKLHAAEARLLEIEHQLMAVRRDATRQLSRDHIIEYVEANKRMLNSDLIEAKKKVIESLVSKIVVKENTAEVNFTVDGVDIRLVALTRLELVFPP